MWMGWETVLKAAERSRRMKVVVSSLNMIRLMSSMAMRAVLELWLGMKPD